jgi:hypothetical protein
MSKSILFISFSISRFTHFAAARHLEFSFFLLNFQKVGEEIRSQNLGGIPRPFSLD